MKISIVLTDGAKQIMMTPESDHEREALKMIEPDDVLKVVSMWGGFGDKSRDHVHFQIAKCQGGYYRPFETRESLMFVIEKVKDSEEEGNNVVKI